MRKEMFYSWDFKMNCLNNNEDSNIKHFYHKVFQLGFIPVMDKPTRFGKNSVIIIYNILTNGIFDNNLKKSIIKCDISDQFTIIFTIQTGKDQSKCQNLIYNKRDFNKANKKIIFTWENYRPVKEIQRHHGS